MLFYNYIEIVLSDGQENILHRLFDKDSWIEEYWKKEKLPVFILIRYQMALSVEKMQKSQLLMFSIPTNYNGVFSWHTIFINMDEL